MWIRIFLMINRYFVGLLEVALLTPGLHILTCFTSRTTLKVNIGLFFVHPCIWCTKKIPFFKWKIFSPVYTDWVWGWKMFCQITGSYLCDLLCDVCSQTLQSTVWRPSDPPHPGIHKLQRTHCLFAGIVLNLGFTNYALESTIIWGSWSKTWYSKCTLPENSAGMHKWDGNG